MSSTEEVPHHVTIQVVNQQCKGLNLIRGLGVTRCTLIDIRSSTEGRTRHLIKIPPEGVSKIPEGFPLRAPNGIRSGAETWFDTDGCHVCRTILSQGSFLVSGRHLEEYDIVYSFVVPSYDAFKRVISSLEAGGIEPKILEIATFKPRGGALSEKQERVLWLALKMGYFNYPRKVDSIELARRLGVVPSTLSEITRRGIRKLLNQYFEEQSQRGKHGAS